MPAVLKVCIALVLTVVGVAALVTVRDLAEAPAPVSEAAPLRPERIYRPDLFARVEAAAQRMRTLDGQLTREIMALDQALEEALRAQDTACAGPDRSELACKESHIDLDALAMEHRRIRGDLLRLRRQIDPVLAAARDHALDVCAHYVLHNGRLNIDPISVTEIGADCALSKGRFNGVRASLELAPPPAPAMIQKRALGGAPLPQRPENAQRLRELERQANSLVPALEDRRMRLAALDADLAAAGIRRSTACAYDAEETTETATKTACAAAGTAVRALAAERTEVAKTLARLRDEATAQIDETRRVFAEAQGTDGQALIRTVGAEGVSAAAAQGFAARLKPLTALAFAALPPDISMEASGSVSVENVPQPACTDDPAAEIDRWTEDARRLIAEYQQAGQWLIANLAPKVRAAASAARACRADSDATRSCAVAEDVAAIQALSYAAAETGHRRSYGLRSLALIDRMEASLAACSGAARRALSAAADQVTADLKRHGLPVSRSQAAEQIVQAGTVSGALHEKQ